jgi:hypothetical protein
MPAQDGKLSTAEQQKIADWLTSKTKSSPFCPICASNNWQIQPHLLQSSIYRPGVGLFVGGEIYPQVAVICGTCAYTRVFAALPILGDISLDEQKKSDSEPPKTEAKNA